MGIGMTEEELSLLFTPFLRSRNEQSQIMNPSGHGVGLFFCRNICESLGGQISAYSELNVGSRFTFSMTAFLSPQHQIKKKKLPDKPEVVTQVEHMPL